MRIVEKRPRVSRRGFLQGSSSLAVGITVIPASSLVLGLKSAHAQSFPTLGGKVGTTLVRMARDIFPHDKLADKYYVQAVAPYDAAAAKDPAFRNLLTEGVAALDASAAKRYGKAYTEVPTEPERVALLKDIEPSPFFQKIKGDLVTGLYDNKEVWPQLGYEGSSWEKGGYMNRGFDDINWL
ncbi:MAG: gluconate 2-dehydrogenase subunit 3 family protein [bacterium]